MKQKYDEGRFLDEALDKEVRMGVRGYDEELTGTLIGWDRYHIILQRESGPMMVYKHALLYLRRE
jgi:sRNA-binding regulator protein Hfq